MNEKKEKPMHFLLARTDNLGDAVATFPFVAKLKEYYPNAKVTMLARNYARDIIERCADIDNFLSVETLREQSSKERISFIKSLNFDVYIPFRPRTTEATWMRKAKIPIRLGHFHRFHFLFNANRFIWRICMRSPHLHYAQVCFLFFKGLGLPHEVSREELLDLMHFKPIMPCDKAKSLLDPKRFNLVLHPGSDGHTLEWPKEHFAALMRLLPDSVKVFVTGNQQEGEKFGDLLKNHSQAVGLFGTLTLSEFTDFLGVVDGVVIGGTGPLHIAAALGTKVIGLFPLQSDKSVARWEPIGKNVITIEMPHCEKSLKDQSCSCMAKITPEQVFAVMQEKWGI